jgi:hypothetical protein
MTETCSTYDRTFVEYGIRSGRELIARTTIRLNRAGWTEPEPGPEFLDVLAAAFLGAYIESAELPLVPETVDAAVDEALGVLAHQLLDDWRRDLSADVLPTFYVLVARFYSQFKLWNDGKVGFWFEETRK